MMDEPKTRPKQSKRNQSDGVKTGNGHNVCSHRAGK